MNECRERVNREKRLLLFTEFKDTLDHLVDKLTKWGFHVGYIHGGMRSRQPAKGFANSSRDPADSAPLSRFLDISGKPDTILTAQRMPSLTEKYSTTVGGASCRIGG